MASVVTVILDGIWGRRGRFARLRRTLERDVGPTEMFNYRADGVGCLRAEAEKFAAAIRGRDPVNVVAFSMGGVVAREAYRADPTLPIRRAAFLNCPHRGSWLAYLASPFKVLRGVRQLRPSSAFIAGLAKSAWRVPTLAVWCPMDYAIVPGTSARWRSASEVVCCPVPWHTWPIRSRSIHARLVRFFTQELTGDTSVM